MGLVDRARWGLWPYPGLVRPAERRDVAKLRDLLDRFRPAGAPGQATSAGVPVDRRAGLSTEVAPIFAALAPVLAECERIREAARVEARRREAEARRRAQAIVAQARMESEAERAAAAAAVRARVTSENEQTLTRAREAARAVREEGERRRPARVARVVELVRKDLAALTGVPLTGDSLTGDQS